MTLEPYRDAVVEKLTLLNPISIEDTPFNGSESIIIKLELSSLYAVWVIVSHKMLEIDLIKFNKPIDMPGMEKYIRDVVYQNNTRVDTCHDMIESINKVDIIVNDIQNILASPAVSMYEDDWS